MTPTPHESTISAGISAAAGFPARAICIDSVSGAAMGELRAPTRVSSARARLLRRTAKRELTADQFCVEAAVRDERGMCSGFDEASGIQHGDEVGVAHRR